MRTPLFPVVSMLILTLFAAVDCHFSWGGQRVGGGGIGVVCRDGTKSIAFVESLDLFEAHEVYKMTLIDDEGSKNGLSTARYKLHWNQDFSDLFEIAFSQVKELWEFVDEELPFSNDAYGETYKSKIPLEFPWYWPKGKKVLQCKQENIAYYDEAESILKVRRELWSWLKPLQQDSVRLHEVAFAIDRRLLGHFDSWNSRTFVQYLLADHDDTEGAPYPTHAEIQKWVSLQMELFISKYQDLLKSDDFRSFDRGIYRPKDFSGCLFALEKRTGNQLLLTKRKNPLIDHEENLRLECLTDSPIALSCDPSLKWCSDEARILSLSLEGADRLKLSEKGSNESKQYVWSY